MGLSLIKKEVQKLSDAIESVLGIHVTIVDENLVRIAATGYYEQFLGRQVRHHSVFEKSLLGRKAIIVKNPKFNEACLDCPGKDDCIELGQICCPIVAEDKVVGVIGLIAFEENQKERIFRDADNIMKFLENVADLISTKLIEKRKSEEVELLMNDLQILINSLDFAVVFTNTDGDIIRRNDSAENTFRLKDAKKATASSLIGKKAFETLKEKGKTEKEFFRCAAKGAEIKGLFNGKAISSKEGVSGYLLTFDKMNDVITMVNKITGSINEINFEDIIGKSAKFTAVKEMAKKAAKSNSTILINGESGTGKELFARAIHFNSDRRNEPFIPINCAAIPDELLESELFGYEEGAFTGAKRGGKTGKFELANKGTLFLDEIGDMQLHLQAKLLRVLQENVIEKVGGNQFIPINVRILAATNKELHEKVALGEFREDLFYRLSVIPIRIISLRERKDDLPLLTSYFLNKYNALLRKSLKGFDETVTKIFMQYEWPGNVRELENTIEYAVNMAGADEITAADLPTRFRGEHRHKGGTPASHESAELVPIAILEEKEIRKAIAIYGSDRDAMEIITQKLGISRATLYRKIKQYKEKSGEL